MIDGARNSVSGARRNLGRPIAQRRIATRAGSGASFLAGQRKKAGRARRAAISRARSKVANTIAHATRSANTAYDIDRCAKFGRVIQFRNNDPLHIRRGGINNTGAHLTRFGRSWWYRR